MTQWIGIYTVCLVVFMIPSGSYCTERLDEAERKLADSKNKYFTTLVVGSRKSVEESQRLKSQILTPAYNEVSRVLNEQNKAFSRNFVRMMPREQFQKELEFAERKEANSSLRDKPIRGVVEFVQTLLRGKDPNRSLAGSPTQGSGSDYSAGGGSSTGTLKKPQVVIDKDAAPKMLQFPGPKKTPSGE